MLVHNTEAYMRHSTSLGVKMGVYIYYAGITSIVQLRPNYGEINMFKPMLVQEIAWS